METELSLATDKLSVLKKWLTRYDSAVIAFSGGVDSTFLASVAKDVYGDRLLLVTATSITYPEYELEEARELAALLQINHRVIVSEEMDIPGFSDNPPDRCYHCKKELFSKILKIAQDEGYDVVFDGSNAEDAGDYRPGMKAKTETGVVSPLAETGFTKGDIRHFSRLAGLPTAEKQAYACLSSRFPYGEKITPDKLARLAAAELDLRKLGFAQFRIRNHGDLARVEVTPAELDRAWNVKDQILLICREKGFRYVCIDLQGYRTGSMNETLSSAEREKYSGS